MSDPLFSAAFPYADDVLDLPVADADGAAAWYSAGFGMIEVERLHDPAGVVLERDGIRLGFRENGRDPGQEGAAILVTDIARARNELESGGVRTGEPRVDERDGRRFSVFFVVAPDGLCYYFHQPLD